ncbi:hypothetical protein SAMN05421759_104165 [Roseivivax lentus]|uniref:Sulfotransferase family protein n=1 Tax=Roseivivax lentus TaxID=633194 RepID=A0A1N7MBG0_9RHOB|nr:hypothetical protein [Roseivivax lentus]SIS83465.1 hypothetical protein SAMN05421759_104165 [Roseivivax lentus]
MALPFLSRKPAAAPWQGPARVIVHCGFRKTGTTSIQDFLRLNADALPEGLSVSARDALTRPFRRAVQAHIHAPGRSALSRVEAEAAALCAHWAQDSGETVLISDENLFGKDIVAEDGRTIFDLAATYLPILERHFGTGPDLHFVFYTRDRDAWLSSAYNQAVKRRGVTADADRWIAAIPGEVDWTPGLAKIRAALSAPVHVFAMEDDLSGAAPLLGRALFRLAGIDDAAMDAMPRPGRSNESLKPAVLDFMRKLNGLDIPLDARRKVGRLVEASQDLFA